MNLSSHLPPRLAASAALALGAFAPASYAQADCAALANQAIPNANPLRSRPLCVYPQRAKLLAGDAKDAASYQCSSP
jgi:hypothetical protein